MRATASGDDAGGTRPDRCVLRPGMAAGRTGSIEPRELSTRPWRMGGMARKRGKQADAGRRARRRGGVSRGAVSQQGQDYVDQPSLVVGAPLLPTARWARDGQV